LCGFALPFGAHAIVVVDFGCVGAGFRGQVATIASSVASPLALLLLFLDQEP
jgi:hypothetical protein